MEVVSKRILIVRPSGLPWQEASATPFEASVAVKTKLEREFGENFLRCRSCVRGPDVNLGRPCGTARIRKQVGTNKDDILARNRFAYPPLTGSSVRGSWRVS